MIHPLIAGQTAVHRRLSIAKALECLPKELQETFDGQTIRKNPVVFDLLQKF
jgi:hypothetical protein